MSRRQVSLARQIAERSRVSLANSLNTETRRSPLLAIGLVVLGGVLLVCYAYSGSDISAGRLDNGYQALDKLSEDGTSCAADVLRALPILKTVYGHSMHKVLHVGPETCSVVSLLLRQDDTEAWGVEPYDLEDTNDQCKRLVQKGIVRVADVKYPLPYRAKSFSLVIISDVVDYLSPRYLNKTLPELTRVSSDGVIIFTGYPGQHRSKLAELSKFGRPAKLRSSTWWIRFFIQNKLEENETAINKFEQTLNKQTFRPSCQVFHLIPRHHH